MKADKIPMHKNAVTIVVLLKNKLITTDAILPILMELKKRYAASIAIKLVFPNIATLKEVEKNLHLSKALAGLQAERLFLRGAGRLSYVRKIAQLIFSMLGKKTIVIKFSDDAFFKQRQLLGVVKKLSQCREILGVLGVPAKAFRPEASNFLRTHNINLKEKGDSGSLINLQTSDYVLSSIPAGRIAEVYGVTVPQERLLYTGYYRSFPTWLDYVNREKNSYALINEQDYCLFILTTLGKRLANLDEPPIEDLLRESLQVLKKFNSRIRTIFKPHPGTDMPKLQQILDATGYENYVIDYAHPMILAAKAKFAIANLFSTTLVDAAYLACPIVEYCQYDPRIMEVLDNRSYGQELCDFFIRRDPQELEKVVAGILDNNLAIDRNRKEVNENFPPMPDNFFDFWDRQMDSDKYIVF